MPCATTQYILLGVGAPQIYHPSTKFTVTGTLTSYNSITIITTRKSTLHKYLVGAHMIFYIAIFLMLWVLIGFAAKNLVDTLKNTSESHSAKEA